MLLWGGLSTTLTMVSPLGLIAGEGIFPFLVARGARAAGRRVVCVGLDGCVNQDLRIEVDQFRQVGMLRLGQWIRQLGAPVWMRRSWSGGCARIKCTSAGVT